MALLYTKLWFVLKCLCWNSDILLLFG